jgi:hypothetical protein
MNYTKRAMIVKKLFRKTVDGCVDWEESFINNGYLTTRDGVSIIIYKDSDDSGSDRYEFRLLNEHGEVVDEFSDEDFDDSDMYNFCAELYSIARGYAKGTEQLLDKLLNSLEDDEPF